MSDDSWGTKEPNMAYMHLGTYYSMLKYFGIPFKLPRKLKKRLLGTRRRRRKTEEAWRLPRHYEVNVRMETMWIGGPHKQLDGE